MPVSINSGTMLYSISNFKIKTAAHFVIGMVLYNMREDIPRALEHLQRACELDPRYNQVLRRMTSGKSGGCCDHDHHHDHDHSHSHMGCHHHHDHDHSHSHMDCHHHHEHSHSHTCCHNEESVQAASEANTGCCGKCHSNANESLGQTAAAPQDTNSSASQRM